MLGVAESLQALPADLLSPNVIMSSWLELYTLILNGFLPSLPQVAGNLYSELTYAGSHST